ncbi:MAG: gliding motility lipoprotein GldH [Muribaculum sp.]|nr:gliding motility lipoprotein GldH [Muribaculaceae bacterium]MCM1080308.1 gliding motility lipoprotein GldH [Muribaculum sp.]
MTTLDRIGLLYWSVASVIAVMLSACTGNPKYSEFSRISEEGWAYGDTFAMTFDAIDSIQHGTLCVALKHNNDYSFANLWLELVIPMADGSELIDTVNIPMADSYGRWYGGGFGSSFQLSDTIGNGLSLDLSRAFRVRHIMRIDTLKNLELIGLTFNPE